MRPFVAESSGDSIFFNAPVFLIIELIYLLHYLISSPSNTGPDENSDYQHRPDRGTEHSSVRTRKEELFKTCIEADRFVETG